MVFPEETVSDTKGALDHKGACYLKKEDFSDTKVKTENDPRLLSRVKSMVS